MKKSVFYTVLFCELTLIVGCMVYYYPMLPENMAIHFGADGLPNGWKSKGSFFVFYGVLVFLLGGIFSGLSSLIPKIPTSLINVPNKEYWFAEERAESSYEILAGFFKRMTCALVLFLGLLFVDTCNTNLSTDIRIHYGTFIPLLLLFLSFVGWNIVWLLRKFNLTPSK